MFCNCNTYNLFFYQIHCLNFKYCVLDEEYIPIFFLGRLKGSLHAELSTAWQQCQNGDRGGRETKRRIGGGGWLGGGGRVVGWGGGCWRGGGGGTDSILVLT